MILQRQQTADVSVIIPVLNERDNLPELYDRLTDTLARLNRACEIIFVDDGSSDGSTELCRSLVQSDAGVTLARPRHCKLDFKLRRAISLLRWTETYRTTRSKFPVS